MTCDSSRHKRELSVLGNANQVYADAADGKLEVYFCFLFFLALWFVLLFAIPVSSKNPTTMASRIIVFEYHRHAISKITRPGPSC